MKQKGFTPLENTNTKQNRKRAMFLTGFTLIELLMVIAIVSLLSTVVLGQVTSVREKGRIAAGQKFDSSMLHSIGDELVGEWKLDGNLIDTSNFGNNGQFVDTPIGYATGVYNEGVSFIGSGGPPRTVGGYIELNENINVDSNNHSISFWYKSSGNYFQMLFQREVGSTNSNIEFAPSDNTVRVESYTNNFWDTRFDALIDIDNGVFHHYALVFNEVDSRLYVDGNLADVETENTDSTDFRYRFFGGAGNTTYTYGECPTGVMDNVRIYSKALTTAQIQQLYAEGLSTHQTLASN